MKLTKLYNELTNKNTNRKSSIHKHYKDTETGLIMIYINGKTRYYDPSIGQFISQNYDCLNPQAIDGLYLYSLESTYFVSNP